MSTIKVKIFVSDLANVMTLYDTICVWRSDSESGEYSLITDIVATSASLVGTELDAFSVHGLTLTIKVDGGADQVITFESPDDVDVDDVVNEINGQTVGVTASNDSGYVKISSNTSGTASSIEIVGGSSISELGFTEADVDYGEAAHIPLLVGVDSYEFDDESGDVSYWYKTQYLNTVSGASSSLSDAVKGSTGAVVPAASLVTGSIDVVDLSGKPVADMLIVFYNVYSPPIVITPYVVVGKTVSVVTDAMGHAEVDLVKGAIVDVTFAGTSITRRIQVPDANFSLWDEISVVDDNFQIQVPEIVDAIRRA